MRTKNQIKGSRSISARKTTAAIANAAGGGRRAMARRRTGSRAKADTTLIAWRRRSARYSLHASSVSDVGSLIPPV
jgi:hypothetical protein